MEKFASSSGKHVNIAKSTKSKRFEYVTCNHIVALQIKAVFGSLYHKYITKSFPPTKKSTRSSIIRLGFFIKSYQLYHFVQKYIYENKHI